MQAILGGGFRCYGADARDDDVRQRVSEIVSVEEFCEVLDCRRTREGDAVAAAGEHCCEFAAVDILRKNCLIRGHNVYTRACLLQCVRQYVTTGCGSW